MAKTQHSFNPVLKAILIGITSVVALAVIGGLIIGYNAYTGLTTAVKEHAQRNNDARTYVQKTYESLTLPGDMTLKSKIQVGDGLDSAPGWEYRYMTNNNPKIINAVRQNLETEGFTVSSSSDTNLALANNNLNLKVLCIYDNLSGELLIRATQGH